MGLLGNVSRQRIKASVDAAKKVYTRKGLVPNTVFIVYGNGSELGRATADTTGKAIVTLASAPGASLAISYGLTEIGITIPSLPKTLPGAPTLGAITVGDGQFTVSSITPPADNGGQAIVDYVLYGVQPDNVFKFIGSYSPAQVASPLGITKYFNNTPIVNGTAIKVFAAARNGVGGSSTEGARSNVITITPRAALTISGTMPNGSLGVAYSFLPAIAGGTPPYNVTATGLPAGVVVSDPLSGATIGTPSAAATYPNILYTVTDANGITATLAGSVTIISVIAPTQLTLSNTAVDYAALLGSDIGTLTADGTSPKFRVTSNNGYVSVSGNRVRLEMQPAATSVTIEAYNLAGAHAETFDLTVIAKAMPAGLKFRFDMLNPAKRTVASGKVTEFYDTVAGYKLTAPVNTVAPLYDTSNTTPNGTPGITVSPSANYALSATADTINDPLKAFLNAADANYTIIALVKTVAAPTAARVLMSTGNTDTTKPGGARYYFSWRQVANVPNMTVLRGDTANAPATVLNLTAPSPATAGLTVHAIRSNGLITTGTIEKVDGGSGTAGNDGAVVANVFSLFNVAINPSAGAAYEGTFYGIMGFDRALSVSQIATATELFAADFGKTYADIPTYIDLSQYTLVANEDFDGDTLPINPTRATDYTTPTGFIPYYPQAAVNEFGSASALGDEKAFYGDFRHERIAPFKDQIIRQENGLIKLTAIPMPSALSDLTLNNGDGLRCTHLSSAFVTLGQTQFSRQYPYVEVRAKQPVAANGRVGADWYMPMSTRWPTEIDSHENLFPTDGSRRCMNLHSDPYGPDYSGQSQDIKMPIYAQVPSLSDNFALYGYEMRPDGIYGYHNRKLFGKMLGYNGAMAVAVTNGGSGIKLADGVSTSGTLRIRAPTTWPFDFASDAIADATVVNGVITSVTIIKPGTRPGSTWVRDKTMTGQGSVPYAFEGTTAPVFNTTFSVDPDVPTQYHIPFYGLYAQQMWNGVAANDTATMEIDYIRVYEKNVAAPAVASTTPQAATDIISRASALGSAFSSVKQGRIVDAVKLMQATKQRFDTVPMGSNTGFAIHQSDWDVTKLSLWDALEDLYAFDALAPDAVQARINWKKPVASGDLVLIGAPSFTAGVGYTLSATTGIQGPSQAGSNLVRSLDNHIGAHITGLAADGTLRRHVGAGTTFGLYSSTTTHETRLMHGGGSINVGMTAQPFSDGHIIASRGWRYAMLLHLNGAIKRAGYFASFVGNTSGVAELVAGQTVPMTIRKLHTGRRLMPKEAELLTSILASI